MLIVVLPELYLLSNSHQKMHSVNRSESDGHYIEICTTRDNDSVQTRKVFFLMQWLNTFLDHTPFYYLIKLRSDDIENRDCKT